MLIKTQDQELRFSGLLLLSRETFQSKIEARFITFLNIFREFSESFTELYFDVKSK